MPNKRLTTVGTSQSWYIASETLCNPCTTLYNHKCVTLFNVQPYVKQCAGSMQPLETKQKTIEQICNMGYRFIFMDFDIFCLNLALCNPCTIQCHQCVNLWNVQTYITMFNIQFSVQQNATVCNHCATNLQPVCNLVQPIFFMEFDCLHILLCNACVQPCATLCFECTNWCITLCNQNTTLCNSVPTFETTLKNQREVVIVYRSFFLWILIFFVWTFPCATLIQTRAIYMQPYVTVCFQCTTLWTKFCNQWASSMQLCATLNRV